MFSRYRCYQVADTTLEQILGLNNIIFHNDMLLGKISNFNNHTLVSFWVFSTDFFTTLCFHYKRTWLQQNVCQQTKTISDRLLMRRQKQNNKGNINQ